MLSKPQVSKTLRSSGILELRCLNISDGKSHTNGSSGWGYTHYLHFLTAQHFHSLKFSKESEFLPGDSQSKSTHAGFGRDKVHFVHSGHRGAVAWICTGNDEQNQAYPSPNQPTDELNDTNMDTGIIPTWGWEEAPLFKQGIPIFQPGRMQMMI